MPNSYILNVLATFSKLFPYASLPFFCAIGCELAKHKYWNGE